MRMLDANEYECDASGGEEGTEHIDLHTPGGRYPTIGHVLSETGEHAGWTITFDFEEDEQPRVFTVRTIAELIDLIEAN